MPSESKGRILKPGATLASSFRESSSMQPRQWKEGCPSAWTHAGLVQGQFSQLYLLWPQGHSHARGVTGAQEPDFCRKSTGQQWAHFVSSSGRENGAFGPQRQKTPVSQYLQQDNPTRCHLSLHILLSHSEAPLGCKRRTFDWGQAPGHALLAGRKAQG